jgi:hypothetical protein
MKEMNPELAKALANLEELQNEAQKKYMWPADMELNGYKLICTCPACPEQYDVHSANTGAKVGYLRLRHGWFRADAPVCGGETVYESFTGGDGIFDDDERIPEITKALEAITAYWDRLTAKD